jgi:hypothetical protein
MATEDGKPSYKSIISLAPRTEICLNGKESEPRLVSGHIVKATCACSLVET